MDTAKILHDYLYEQPEHPVPHAGDVVHLVYPPRPGDIGVVVNTAADDVATFTIAVPAELMTEAVNDACAALVRSTGGSASSAGTVAALRESMGERAFDERIGNMVRLQFLSVAVMRTRVLPFLAPRILSSGAYRDGHDYSFQAQVTLRPSAELTDYSPARVSLPEPVEVSDRDVNGRIGELMGGEVPWEQVGEAQPGSSLARMRDEVRGQLEAKARDEWRNACAEACADALAPRLTKTPPTRHVEMLREVMANDYAADIVDGGQDWDEYVARPEFDMEEFKARMTEMALTSLRRGMVLDAVAERAGVTLSEAEVRDAVGLVARGHEDEALDGMLRTCQLPQLLESTLRIKAGDLIVRQALRAADAGGEAADADDAPAATGADAADARTGRGEA